MKQSRLKIVNTYQKIFDYVNKRNLFFYLLCAFDFMFVVLNIYKRITVVGVLFLLINISFMLFSNKKKLTYVIFLLYPLARVLKFNFMSTSFFTILIPFYILFMFMQMLLFKQKITLPKIIVLIIYSLYVLFTFIISMLNFKGFSIKDLFSYYLYLSIPIFAFIFIFDKFEIDGTWSLLICSISYLFGIAVTLGFYYVIPNGSEFLKNAGVVVFDMGAGGIRFSPLTDDPNYGSALILLIGSLFFLAKKTKIQYIVGIPVVLISLSISCFTLSKMYILGFIILLLCVVLKFCNRKDNLLVNLTILSAGVVLVFVALNTKIGNTILIRLIGTRDGINLDRLTSGRATLFGEYSSYILSNPLVVVLGKGPLYSDLSYFTSGEHNTFTKNIFGNGIVGVSLMLAIFIVMLKNRFDDKKDYKFSFYSFALFSSIVVCCMSLGLAPSTVFPIFVLGSQFTIINEKINNKVGNLENETK